MLNMYQRVARYVKQNPWNFLACLTPRQNRRANKKLHREERVKTHSLYLVRPTSKES